VSVNNIYGSDVSCGVLYYHDLSLESFKTVLQGKKPPKPKVQLNWGSPGYYENQRAWDAYWDAQEDAFEKGYCYIFSDNDKGAGASIAKFIRDNDLGKIVSSGWGKNPNSGNKICTWIWRYNGKRPKANAKRKKAARRVGRRHAAR